MPGCCPRCYLYYECDRRDVCCRECEYYAGDECLLSEEYPEHEEKF
jgi:hypothetical protein